MSKNMPRGLQTYLSRKSKPESPPEDKVRKNETLEAQGHARKVKTRSITPIKNCESKTGQKIISHRYFRSYSIGESFPCNG